MPRRMRIRNAILTPCMLWLLGCGAESDTATAGETASYLEQLAAEFGNPSLEPFTGDLPELRERRLIRALVTPSRTDFFVDSGQIRGIQAEFLREFGKQLNAGVSDEAKKIRIEYVPVPFDELIPALRAGRGDIAAAFLTVTRARADDVRFTKAFRRSVSEVIVTHADSPTPRSLDELGGSKLYVLSSSSYSEHLRALNEVLIAKGIDPIDIEEADSRLRSEDILEFVNAGVVTATAVDDYKARLWSRVLPDIRVHEDLRIAEQNQVAWAVRTDSPELAREVDRFVVRVREGALLGNILLDRYFGSERFISNPNARDERDKLQRYLELFERYGEEFDIDPLALAAQAYQESGLNPVARSAAGAIGLMQILPSTAADPNVGIPDIEAPDANVHAAAKYLAFVRDRYFADPELDEWSRRAFTWAAYNAGPRKIVEARALASRLGLDPARWFGNVEVATARLVGREPVRYVANIHRYHIAYRLARLNQEMRREAAQNLE